MRSSENLHKEKKLTLAAFYFYFLSLFPTMFWRQILYGKLRLSLQRNSDLLISTAIQWQVMNM